MIRVPYHAGKGKKRHVAGYWFCSDEDADLAQRDWKLAAGGYVYESGKNGSRASRLIAERMLNRPLQADEDVHHRDENKLNNRRENLEAKTHGQHAADHNRDENLRRGNGLPPGCSWDRSRIRARIQKDGLMRHLGTFDTVEEASAAYQKALGEEEN